MGHGAYRVLELRGSFTEDEARHALRLGWYKAISMGKKDKHAHVRLYMLQ